MEKNSYIPTIPQQPQASAYINIVCIYLKSYVNDSQRVQVMETISMHCKSISQIQSGAYSELKVNISLVEHT